MNLKIFSFSILLIAFTIIIARAFFIAPNQVAAPTPPERLTENRSDQEPSITAQFEIFTNGVKRTFDNPMYHNQSEIAYITAEAPSQITVTDYGVTWAEFFETLPFSITASCLITGTGEEYCTNDSNELTFILNNQNTKDALTKVIQSNDSLIIRYE